MWTSALVPGGQRLKGPKTVHGEIKQNNITTFVHGGIKQNDNNMTLSIFKPPQRIFSKFI
jgi:hypothetical protein